MCKQQHFCLCAWLWLSMMGFLGCGFQSKCSLLQWFSCKNEWILLLWPEWRNLHCLHHNSHTMVLLISLSTLYPIPLTPRSGDSKGNTTIPPSLVLSFPSYSPPYISLSFSLILPREWRENRGGGETDFLSLRCVSMQKSAINYFFFDNVTLPTLHFYLPFTHHHLISTLFQIQANVMCVFVCVHSLIHAMCVFVPQFPPPLPKN